jgi:hypothetical protein
MLLFLVKNQKTAVFITDFSKNIIKTHEKLKIKIPDIFDLSHV